MARTCAGRDACKAELSIADWAEDKAADKRRPLRAQPNLYMNRSTTKDLHRYSMAGIHPLPSKERTGNSWPRRSSSIGRRRSGRAGWVRSSPQLPTAAHSDPADAGRRERRLGASAGRNTMASPEGGRRTISMADWPLPSIRRAVAPQCTEAPSESTEVIPHSNSSHQLRPNFLRRTCG